MKHAILDLLIALVFYIAKDENQLTDDRVNFYSGERTIWPLHLTATVTNYLNGYLVAGNLRITLGNKMHESRCTHGPGLVTKDAKETIIAIAKVWEDLAAL